MFNRGLINYVDIRAKCCHLKILTCKGALGQVFIIIYRLVKHSVMLVFSTQDCELLPPRIRELIGSVIGGRAPATQGSSGPCVYCRKPGVRSLYTYVAS
jgi:hypothetical protein